ncbi:helix-turn-helix transcriptional regulator [Apilactobacillus bombintestini]|uniref:Transcriptional regulator n=1 Tax=Apilactobacillus bombintestini TaxID=2419772 RepID=A0A387AR74_9LACO|nr:helix-turn-helix transcriptional regulator [Apilactobacillus bombintestini]AYF92128.1 transcriptional regulator [Apilactobacillus bombintestini]
MNMKNYVREMRNREGMQQKELAKVVGVSRQTLSLIEKGDYNPSLRLCINIAQALNTDLNTLFWRHDNE